MRAGSGSIVFASMPRSVQAMSRSRRADRPSVAGYTGTSPGCDGPRRLAAALDLVLTDPEASAARARSSLPRSSSARALGELIGEVRLVEPDRLDRARTVGHLAPPGSSAAGGGWGAHAGAHLHRTVASSPTASSETALALVVAVVEGQVLQQVAERLDADPGRRRSLAPTPSRSVTGRASRLGRGAVHGPHVEQRDGGTAARRRRGARGGS